CGVQGHPSPRARARDGGAHGANSTGRAGARPARAPGHHTPHFPTPAPAIPWTPRVLEAVADLRHEAARRRHVELRVTDLALGDHVTIVAEIASDHRRPPVVVIVGEPGVDFGERLGEERVPAVERPL